MNDAVAVARRAMQRTIAEAQAPELRLKMPLAHAKQAEILASPARRKVICAGRRAGKTMLVSMIAAEGLLKGNRVLMAAPREDQTGAFWEYTKRILQPLIDAKVVRKTESPRMIEHPSGGRIRAKTAWDADSLRGDYADKLILDEFAYMKPEAWEEVGAPMMMDHEGSEAYFISTPLRRNHFFQMYNRAMSDPTGRWAAWRFTSMDNSYLDDEARAEMTADMSEEAYQQEILAQFLENSGSVFRNLDVCCNALPTEPEAHVGHEIVIGADWGKTRDYTAMSAFCCDCKREVALLRFNQVEYYEAQKRLERLAAIWDARKIWAERNAMGEPILEALGRMGLPVVGFQTTALSKPPLIENLALAFEREEAHWLADPVGRAELEAYERTTSLTTGRSQYSAPSGLHDDTVMARALSWWGAGRRLSTGAMMLDVDW